MPAAQHLFPRHAQRSVSAALADTRVVVITGARQTGKSTLARLIAAAFPGSELRYLDEAPVRATAQADPSLFVRHNGLLVISCGASPASVRAPITLWPRSSRSGPLGYRLFVILDNLSARFPRHQRSRFRRAWAAGTGRPSRPTPKSWR